MRHICIVGLQWGDEGKGKIVDVLTEGMDAVVRYQGGANAGHTVKVGDRCFVLHHIPTGILRDGVSAVLGNGMVIEPEALLAEISTLEPEARSRIFLSERAHCVLPLHRSLDRQREEGAGAPIGTTLRGIGPTYESKFARRGVRLGDLQQKNFLSTVLPERLRAAGQTDEEITATGELLRRFMEVVGDRIVDTQRLLCDLHSEGKRMLFEGAQGSLLDVDFGTYPFVTSSSPSFLGVGPGSGFSPRKIDHVLGVTKVYCTRVGEGPFPSELAGAEGEALREAGGEFGTTTGRPRRCGWLDLPALRFALELNDVDSMALAKADVLSGRDTVPVVVGYRSGSQLIDRVPARAEDLEQVEPVLEEWPGWASATPEAMAPFLERLTERVGVPVSVLSTGARRDQVQLFEPFASRQELTG